MRDVLHLRIPAVVSLLAVACLLAALTLVARHILTRPYTPAPSRICGSNLRQLGLAIERYASEHQRHGPQRLAQVLESGVLSSDQASVLWCPGSAEEQRGVETNYVLRSEVADGTLLLDSYSGEPIVWDDPTAHRHRNGAEVNVAYADGAVKAVDIGAVAPPEDPDAKQWPALIEVMRDAYAR